MTLRGEIEGVLTPGMVLPEALGVLLDWIETNGLVLARRGKTVGTLYPVDAINAGWTDSERPGGTYVEFYAEGNEHLHHWFGHENPSVLGRLCVIGRAGADGSMLALWLDPEDQTRIVHIGSGSGSSMVSLLGATAVDFLRLLAIGYDEICWGCEVFDKTSEEAFAEAGLVVHPNHAFREWVCERFDVTIPARGIEVVPHPGDMNAKTSSDPFCCWIRG